MKQYTKLFYVVLILVAAISCKKEEVIEEKPFIIESKVVFPVQGGTDGYIRLADDAGTYTASTKSEWCTLATNGQTINISVTSNGSISARYASIVVECQGKTEYVSVYQYGSICDFGQILDLDLTCLEQTYVYPEKIKSDLPVEVSTTETWAVATISNEMEVSISVEMNGGNSERSCKMILSAESGISNEVTIKQRGASLVTSKDTASIKLLRGGMDSIVVVSPIPYTVRCLETWCSTVIVEDTLIIVADYTIADRSTKIYLDYGTSTKEIIVLQELGYEDFIGSDWKIWSLSSSASVFSYVNMTITEKVKGQSFTATTAPLAYAGGTSITPVPNYNLSIEMTYDSSTKTVKIIPQIVAHVTVLSNNGTYSGQTVENADLWMRATNGASHTPETGAYILGTWDASSGTPSITFEGAEYFSSGSATVSGFLLYPYYPGSKATTARLRSAYAFRLQTGQGLPIHITKQ